jgi:hypothetical protein
MKRWLVLLLLTSLSWGQELKRPTAEDSGATASSIGCSGVATASSAMPLSWDASGLSTQSPQTVIKAYKGTQSKTRRFLTWGAGGTYTALTLNINSQSAGWVSQSMGAGEGSACMAYSLDGGHVWTSIACDSGAGWAQQTFSVTLSPTQNLTTVQVGVCVGGSALGGFGDVGGDVMNVYDIWTLGTTNSAPVGNGSTSGLPHRGVVVVN